MARCPHCGVFEGYNHHSLCPALQRKPDPAMHRHNGTDYAHANDCPYCWREASDIQSATIERLSSKLAEKERECERLREWRAAVIAANDDEPHCIYCRGFLDTGMECNDCGRDNMPFYRALENDDG